MESRTHSNMEFTIWTSEIKKDSYTAYQIGDWIKAGVRI